MDKPTALVVDDEEQMLMIVSFALQTQGFECVTAQSAQEALAELQKRDFDLAVIDVMLPGGSGIELTRTIRQTSALPIILLTALSDESHRIAGLEAGADDYVVKPFSPRELALRAQAIVRRTMPEKKRESLKAGPFVINRRTLETTYDGQIIELSDTEAKLLLALAVEPGAVVHTRELLEEVWHSKSPIGGRDMAKTAVYRLRKSLEKWGITDVVESVRGVGYRLNIE